jgi:hypothetical protein
VGVQRGCRICRRSIWWLSTRAQPRVGGRERLMLAGAGLLSVSEPGGLPGLRQGRHGHRRGPRRVAERRYGAQAAPRVRQRVDGVLRRLPRVSLSRRHAVPGPQHMGLRTRST